jgi:hypothetical protein
MPTASRGLSSNQRDKRHRCSSPKRRRAPVVCIGRGGGCYSARHRPAAASPRQLHPDPSGAPGPDAASPIPDPCRSRQRPREPLATRRPSQPAPPSCLRPSPIRPSPPSYPATRPLLPHSRGQHPLRTCTTTRFSNEAQIKTPQPMPVPAKANTHRLPAFRSRFFAVSHPQQNAGAVR